MRSIERALLAGLIDYAGLFPPAGLGMPEVVANYATYRTRPDAYALARLVVPVARLEEFEQAWARLDDALREGPPWPISALAGPEPRRDRTAIADFNRRRSADGPRIEALELRVATVAQADAVLSLPAEGVEVYCELPLSVELPALVAAVRRAGARAKIRTGGVQPGDIPSPEAVLGFLGRCAAERLPFKATAGLHHPVRGVAPLTYEADSPCATMFGYLNVVLAAAVLWGGGPEGEALSLLTAERSLPIRFRPDRIEWNGVGVSAEAIGRARREFILAIGSCSFTEPMSEIRAHGLDPATGILATAPARSHP